MRRLVQCYKLRARSLHLCRILQPRQDSQLSITTFKAMLCIMMLRTSFIIFLNTIKSVLCCQRLLRFVTNQICLCLAAACNLSQYMSIQVAFTKESVTLEAEIYSTSGECRQRGQYCQMAFAKWCDVCDERWYVRVARGENWVVCVCDN